MSLQFIFGNSGSGKSDFLYDSVLKQAKENKEQQFLIIVPEQFTMQTQRELVERQKQHAIMNVDVLSFARLAYRVFDDLGKQNVVVLEETGKNLVLRKVAEQKKAELKVLGANMNKMDDGMYIPNNMITAQAYFKSDNGGAYDSDPLKFNYDGNSDFRIGLIKNVTVTNDWTIVKNFKLYYLGVDPTGISEIVTDANAVATKIYNASGMQIGKLQKGINIIETVMKDGSKKVKKVVVK